MARRPAWTEWFQVELSVRAIYEQEADWLKALASLRDYGFRPVHRTTVTRDESLGVVELDCLAIRAGAPAQM